MKDTAKIFLKVLSIYYLVEFITKGLPQVFGLINSGSKINISIILGIVISHFLYLFIAILLWYGADKIVNYMVRNEGNDSSKRINYQKIHLIAFSLIGVVILVISIPDLIQYILEYYFMPSMVFSTIL